MEWANQRLKPLGEVRTYERSALATALATNRKTMSQQNAQILKFPLDLYTGGSAQESVNKRPDDTIGRRIPRIQYYKI